MNKIFKTITTTVVTFALLAGAFNAPIVAVAHAQTAPTSGFTFELPGFDLPDFDFDLGGGDSSTNITIQTCRITATNTTVVTGGSTTLNWDTSGFDVFTLNGQSLSLPDGDIEMTNILQNTTYELIAATADGSADCVARITVTCVPPPVDCRLEVLKTVDKTTANVGDNITYSITVKNVGTSNCTGSGVKIEDVLSDKLTYLSHTTSSNITPGYDGGIAVYTPNDRTVHFNGNILSPNEIGTMTITAKVNTPSSCGDFEIPNQAKATALELNNFGTWAYSQTVKTNVSNGCVDPAPNCDSFTSAPSTITVGASSKLTWETSNATQVVINNGIGNVTPDGNISVAPLTTTTYTLTAFGTNNRQDTCEVNVTVSDDPVPVCEFFRATPSALPAGGGNVNLSWKVNNATNVSISPTIGSVSAENSQSINVLTSTNFILTATDADGDTVSCPAPVTVAETPVFTCQNNVSFTASDYSITRGNDTVLTWNVTGADSASISTLGTVAFSESRSVEPSSDTTYVLTAKKGNLSIDCPLKVAVTSGGGGGGGSSSPRCELSISDNKIRAGQEITLKWKTTRATEVNIKDNRGKTIVKSDDKDDLDGSIKLKPTRDTEYTLVAEKGSKERTCKVKVDVDDLKVITDREPTVAGISLSNVPYTGFEAGPMLTMVFYLLLIAWALFVAYLIIVRPRFSVGVAGGAAEVSPMDISPLKKAEVARPDLFPVVASVAAPVATAVAPANLPTGTPVVGYENAHQVTDEVVTALENRAHGQKALLSSDAIRHFIATTEGSLERNEALDEVITEAKSLYPLEDGWIVVNEARMRALCESCMSRLSAAKNEPYEPTIVPEGSSSLAEAIVTGNIVAAYEMIGNRPMFALADAAADLDAVIRIRRGEEVSVSDLLKAETASLADEKIKNMIAALTGALDGTYTDEASAVKIAIMKAVKEVATLR